MKAGKGKVRVVSPEGHSVIHTVEDNPASVILQVLTLNELCILQQGLGKYFSHL